MKRTGPMPLSDDRNWDGETDLLIVGAYPDNAPRPDQYRGRPAEHDDVVQKIAAVPSPAADPVTGGDGPLRRLWGTAAG